MIKRIKYIALGITLGLTSFSAFYSTAKAELNDNLALSENYLPLLDSVNQLLKTHDDEHFDYEGSTGILEATSQLTYDEALNKVGFYVKDISGDNIPELIIGTNNPSQGLSCNGTVVYAVYTLDNNSPVIVFEGWAKNSYCALGNGKFFNQGTSSESNSIYGVYSISKDGKTLSCDDVYYTYKNENNPSEIGFYHNKTGQIDKNVEDEIHPANGDLKSIIDNLIQGSDELELTLFSDYENYKDKVKAPIYAKDAKDILPKLKSYSVYVVGEERNGIDILITPKTKISGLNINKLTLIQPKEDDGIKPVTFQETLIYTEQLVTPNKPLVLNLQFMGSIPSHGISFTDENGVVKHFYITESGFDGSVVLTPFTPEQ